jgi:hypothetical protein
MNDPRNPYAPPVSQVADPEDAPSPDTGRFIPYGRSLPAGRGAAWIGDAWRLLKGQAGMWAAALVLLFVAWIVLSIIPVVKHVLQLATPFIYAGVATAANEQRRNGSFELNALLAGFNKRPLSLLGVSLALVVAGMLFLAVLAISVGASVFGAMLRGAQADPSVFLTAKFGWAFLVGIVVMLPISFATYLAPQLIILHDQPTWTALKMSLVGCAKNILPGIVFSICAALLVLVSIIPLFLGLLVSIPVLFLTNYTVYRDIFVEENP